MNPKDQLIEDIVAEAKKLNGGGEPNRWSLVDVVPDHVPPVQGEAKTPKRVYVKSRLVTVTASTVKPRNIDFVWPGRLARGKHTAFAGEGGLGKSQLLVDVTARITAGSLWPCSTDRAPTGSVIILSAEDGVEDVLIPRLMASGADLERVHIVKAVSREDGRGERRFSLQQDLEELEKKITDIGNVLLVWIDPVSSYMGKVDSHNNTALRSVLDPISEMAERTNVAFASVTHFTKGSVDKGIKAVHRVMGGAAFTTAPRAAFAVLEDPDDKDRRLVLHLKNNLAAKPPGLAFRLGARMIGLDERDNREIWATHVLWEDRPVDTTADEAIAASVLGAEQEASALDEACTLLRDQLASGPVPARDIEECARAHMISRRTLMRARAKLGIVSEKTSFDGRWTLKLPQGCQGGPKGASQKERHPSENLAPFDVDGGEA
jgi:putative DNA primase/helicase